MTRKSRLEKIIAPPKPRRASQVRILTERSPTLQPPGKARRFAHVSDEMVRQGATVLSAPVLANGSSEAGLVERFVRVLFSAPTVLRTTTRHEPIIVIGLGEVHMLLLSMILSASGRNVTFDACDSWRLQMITRWNSGRRARAAIPALGAILQSFAPRSMSVSYISKRDRQADRRICRRLNVCVIVPSAPAELLRLDPPASERIKRIVVVADMNSSHNSNGLDALLDVWVRVRTQYPDLRLELFGKGLPTRAPAGATVRGWAPAISDIYDGDTGVFVTNVLESGVPNKLVEAVAAQRPVLIHSSLRHLVEPHPWVVEWNVDLESGVRQLLELSLVPAPDFKMELS